MSKIFVSGLQVQEMLSRNCDELVKAQDRAASLQQELDQAQKCIEALNICIKHDDRIEAALKVKVTRLEELLTDVQFMLDDHQSAGTITRHIVAALKDIPDA